MNSPLISIVLPVFNAEKYLAESIESILNQTYTNFELIIIDDGSTDNSFDIVTNFANEDSRIISITRENRGLVKTLNEGILIAKGEWIARMDSDDVCMPDRLQVQLDFLNRTKADLCGGWIRLLGTRTRRIRRYPMKDDEIKLLLCFRTAFAHPSIIIRASLIKRYLYNDNVERAQDYELWTRLAMSDVKMTNVQSVVLKYRIHSDQISENSREQQVKARDLAQKNYINEKIAQEGAFETFKKFASPYDSPGYNDAVTLKNMLVDVSWASAMAKLSCFRTALRYVRPSNYSVYQLYATLRRELNIKFEISELSLALQSLLRLSTDTNLYKLIKRLG